MATTRVAPSNPAPAQATQAAPAKAAPAGAAKPGTIAPAAKDEKKDKVKASRVFHPMLKPEMKTNEKSGKQRLEPTAWLKEIPADFDIKVHKPLQRKHFEDESLWYELRARHYESLAAKMRQEGAAAKVAGSSADRVKAKRLAQMVKKVEELKTSLAGQGVDVEALLKAALASAAPAEEKKS